MSGEVFGLLLLATILKQARMSAYEWPFIFTDCVFVAGHEAMTKLPTRAS